MAADNRSFDPAAQPTNRSAPQDTELGAGTPANVDIHKLGQDDKPEQDWGDPAGEGSLYSSTHTRRGEKTEAERGQGRKTRAATKDQISRRA